MTPGVRLGLGLIGIGRPWPTDRDTVCPEGQAFGLLDAAVQLGIRFFDTAAAYGTSEAVLGRFLATLPAQIRRETTVATKCGEIWPSTPGHVPDHSVDALSASLERSLGLLEQIDLLQLHKCTVADLRDDKLLSWLTGLRSAGVVGAIGVSVSTVDAITEALAVAELDAIQFPGNVERREFVDMLRGRNSAALPLVNRPMASGALAGAAGNPFRFHHETLTRAVVLTGTRSPEHLAANARLFAEARRGGDR